MNPLTVHVVIPAHDEEELIGAAVAAARIACARAEAELHVRTTCTVVADACTDDTARIARAAGAEVLAVHAHRVGAARRAGIDRARQLVPSRARDSWIACTDADSVVPSDWLLAHLRQRRAGADLVLGSVRPRATDLPTPLMEAWLLRHHPDRARHGVYGANMSFGAVAYDVIGGFAPLVAHEDRTLVEAFRRHGLQVQYAPAIEVVTSGRLLGRAPEGFATYLHTLGQRIMATGSIPCLDATRIAE
jgi:glycosyltransferase involved in cell wall biosynthesis